MRTIWKYELAETDVQMVSMPKGAVLLSVAGQPMTERGNTIRSGVFPMLWASVDPDAPKVDRVIAVVGTGNPGPELGDGVFVGSAICPPFVWHVFDGGESAHAD
jgi:hypothetical protein